MAIPAKLILIEKNERIGVGLQAIREKEASAIDITEFGGETNAFGDSTSASNKGFIIKNNKVYTIMKTFMDLDKNCRYFVAKDEGLSSNIWPVG